MSNPIHRWLLILNQICGMIIYEKGNLFEQFTLLTQLNSANDGLTPVMVENESMMKINTRSIL